ncbi:uncharacterized protein LOC110976223 [Acanthaster planci]|uniref:Centrosomal protein of 70 kDa n=1 Tax=Acanthaster planci TaxID=133434 RepID=A0A8B7XVV9_ACAPL|nr:uncharacterized protein LOC110976223 [Acanthaster planci]XP_022085013.1 uncharacterized protein LOC110976223 [Acanthaster planci]
MPHQNESEYASVLQQLRETTKSVLNDLQQLKTNPLLASSSTSCQYVDHIASKTQEVIQIVDQLSTRARHKETKSSKYRDASAVTMPNILQNVSMQQYHNMEVFTKQVLDIVELGASFNLPVVKSSHHHATDGDGHKQGHKHIDRRIHRSHHPHRHKHSMWCQRSYHHVVPTLESWIHLLAEARDKTPSVVKARMDSEHAKMVAHFQRLFDVPTEGGVYTRMNELYSRVGEMQNVLHSLRDVLGLDEAASTNSIVTATTQLCELYSSSTTHLLGQLLQQEHLDRVISRMEHYRKFFPIFDSMVKDLMEILGVVSMDRIVPAVRALKLLAS